MLLDGIENINEESLTLGNNEPLIVSTRKKRFISDNGSKFLIGVIHDITQLKEAQKDLKTGKTTKFF